MCEIAQSLTFKERLQRTLHTYIHAYHIIPCSVHTLSIQFPSMQLCITIQESNLSALDGAEDFQREHTRELVSEPRIFGKRQQRLLLQNRQLTLLHTYIHTYSTIHRVLKGSAITLLHVITLCWNATYIHIYANTYVHTYSTNIHQLTSNKCRNEREDPIILSHFLNHVSEFLMSVDLTRRCPRISRLVFKFASGPPLTPS